MYWGMNVRLIGAVAALSLVFLSGWWVNGWRWEARYKALEKQYVDSVLQAEQEARRREQVLQVKAEQEVRKKNDQIRSIRNQLDRALVELRNRPSRQPVDPSAPQGASGAELSREDAEFLTREASRADEAVAALLYCYRIYDQAREILQQGKP